MNGKFAFRIVSAIVMIAAIAAIAFFAFNAVVAKGSPITIDAPEGQVAPVPYPYFGHGYGMPFHRPFGFGFGCFGILFTIFFLVLALKAFRFAVWGPRFGHASRMHGPWRGHWGENGVPPMFDEWHKRAHESPKESTQENK